MKRQRKRQHDEPTVEQNSISVHPPRGNQSGCCNYEKQNPTQLVQGYNDLQQEKSLRALTYFIFLDHKLEIIFWYIRKKQRQLCCFVSKMNFQALSPRTTTPDLSVCKNQREKIASRFKLYFTKNLKMSWMIWKEHQGPYFRSFYANMKEDKFSITSGINCAHLSMQIIQYAGRLSNGKHFFHFLYSSKRYI